MSITTYTDVQDAGLLPGQIYSEELAASIRTGYNADTVVLPAGFGCVKGTNQGEVILPSGAGTFMGIIKLPFSLEKRTGYSLDTAGRFGYPVNYETAYVNQGVIAVYVDDTVAEGNPVYLNHTASTSVVGAFRNDANTANAQLVDGAKFLSGAVGTASSLAIALVSINAA
ncbi:hypothetical protein D0962_22645 [Leptolyngbyaceae cyanobacterium CCMR0082]|uniref:Uncharacterized protein n=1 Tax=Adonisia turfae CCMR0082 TaxID=2304604 RepID=A0A6M0SAM0_9CYAN|nr:hypothetical protein [Adonisia turfae]NEZ65527.1 hypothetical protein [Adonisia turfae CCMR0082]